jgi:copper homeostasis protein CutC
MPGSGIKKENLQIIVKKIKAKEYHGTKIIWILSYGYWPFYIFFVYKI